MLAFLCLLNRALRKHFTAPVCVMNQGDSSALIIDVHGDLEFQC